MDYAKRLRDSARKIEIDGTPSQVGMSPNELRDAADEIKGLLDGMHSLYLTLSTAKEKLECYRAAHGGEYVGGVEYTSLIRDMKDAQLLAIKLQGKLPPDYPTN